MGEMADGFVAVTDIADFYPRIYHHRLDNALQVATSKSSHIKALKQLLSGWNKTESYGIPVGSAPSRLLAELVMTDIDQALLAQGIDFIRFNDDYRIFSPSYSEAYQALAFLAEKLFRNHGLTLQPQKTEILPTDAFHEKYLATPLDKELGSLHEKFDEIIRELGLADLYEPIDPAELSESEKTKIEALNLDKLFVEQIDSKSELDIPLCRFLLRRFAQFSDSGPIDKVLDNVERLYPIMPDVVNYIASLSRLQVERRREIARKLLEQLDNTLLNSLEYYRIWSLEIFAKTNYWDCEERFLKFLSRFPDQFSRRKLILAMARSGTYRHWFQSQWREAENEAPWPFRALLAGFSCLPPDARKHLYQSMEPGLDPLQKAVIKWARNQPLG